MTSLQKSKKFIVVLIVVDGFNLFEFSCCAAVLMNSATIAGATEVRVASLKGGAVRGSWDIVIETHALQNISATSTDRVVLIGASLPPKGADVAFLRSWLKAQAAGLRLAAVGTGADLLLAALEDLLGPSAAGALKTARGSLGRDGPVAVQAPLAWFGHGQATTLDLMLSLLAEDLGRPHALDVARVLGLYVWRRPDEPACSAMMTWQHRGGAQFSALNEHIRRNLSGDLGVEALAEWCGMTPRTFARRYVQECGVTPAAAVMAARVEHARILMAEKGLSLAEIARLVGLGSEVTLRRALKRRRRGSTRLSTKQRAKAQP